MTAAPNLPAIIAARYVPVRLIAKGGMGAVYEVEHARTGERLALKVLLSGVGAPAETLERFKREARASARIKSEHVVRVIDADVAPELDGAPFLVMELLEGMDLERKTKATRPDPATVLDWLRQVAGAVDKAHRVGIIHRDLKPENLFLATAEDRPPMVKLLDFGIVKMAEERTGATGSGQILGTPQYMAPEQATSSARITSATDRYALGLVAYRLLTGESYYHGDVIGILAQLLHEPLRAPSQQNPALGGAFDVWFARACARDPDERFASAAEQVEALSAALGLPAMAAVGTPGVRSGPAAETIKLATRRPRAVLGLAVAAVLAGGTIAGLVISRRRPDVEKSPSVSTVAPSAPPAAAPPAAAPPAAPPPPAPVAAADIRRGGPKLRPRAHRPAAAPPAPATVNAGAKTLRPEAYADQK